MQIPCPSLFLNLPQTVTVFLYISTMTLYYGGSSCVLQNSLIYTLYKYCHAIVNYRTGWYRGNAIDFYSEGSRFESWVGHWFSSQIFLLVLGSARKSPG
jgi:hypothetical protein